MLSTSKKKKIKYKKKIDVEND